MRTDEEILERIKERRNNDLLGWELGDLLCVLPFDKAKEFLSEEYQNECKEWKIEPRDRESVLKRMEEYMPFAWEKANNGRGLSAMRSMCHYMAWTWLIGDDLGELTKYQYYGKDNLRKICEKYGWDADQWDDGVRVN